MQRYQFVFKAGAALALGAALAACTTTATPTVTQKGASDSDQRREIAQGVDSTLNRLYATVPDARNLVGKASGVVVFPRVIAAGFGIGGQYGKGALRVKNSTVGYYSLASVSVGLQIGAQSKAVVLLLMTPEVLEKFRQSEGWAAGIDGSVAVLKVGANGAIDTTTAGGPVLAFVLTNAGLMANITLEGTKISRLKI
ncbi:MAG TPA: hypothetical protein DCW29_18120 [Janthinobacterium sp.]|nr:hypothetical protein [Janthinobacterium sp.]